GPRPVAGPRRRGRRVVALLTTLLTLAARSLSLVARLAAIRHRRLRRAAPRPGAVAGLRIPRHRIPLRTLPLPRLAGAGLTLLRLALARLTVSTRPLTGLTPLARRALPR